MSWVLLWMLAADPTVEKAVRYLTTEVQEWKKANNCYSCHNNGDAARALMAAGKARDIADTLRWLESTTQWDNQQADAPFRDKNLARIQFSFALADAVEAGAITRGQSLQSAAMSLAAMQAADGSWPLEQDSGIGSPATYGTPLATYAAVRVLQFADARKFASAIERAKAWMTPLRSAATPDLAAMVLTLHSQQTAGRLASQQNADGGWGPYPKSPSEVFDTAIAMLALSELPSYKPQVQRGAEWLRKAQLANGGWAATTRPSGAVSYAQHISTSGWATLALLKAGR